MSDKDHQRRIEVLCDHVHGTMKAAHVLALESGCSEEAWRAIIDGAVSAMEIEACQHEENFVALKNSLDDALNTLIEVANEALRLEEQLDKAVGK